MSQGYIVNEYTSILPISRYTKHFVIFLAWRSCGHCDPKGFQKLTLTSSGTCTALSEPKLVAHRGSVFSPFSMTIMLFQLVRHHEQLYDIMLADMGNGINMWKETFENCSLNGKRLEATRKDWGLLSIKSFMSVTLRKVTKVSFSCSHAITRWQWSLNTGIEYRTKEKRKSQKVDPRHRQTQPELAVIMMKWCHNRSALITFVVWL